MQTTINVIMKYLYIYGNINISLSHKYYKGYNMGICNGGFEGSCSPPHLEFSEKKL